MKNSLEPSPIKFVFSVIKSLISCIDNSWNDNINFSTRDSRRKFKILRKEPLLKRV
jgi:hypothetical protein